MNEKKILYYHLGYPKCASTFLQKNVFPKIENLNYLNLSHNTEHTNFVNFLIESNDENFRKNFLKYTGIFNNLSKDKINLLSMESFTNFAGKRNFLIKPSFERLKYVSDILNIQVKPIVIIRNQSDYLMSRYAQGHGINSFFSVNKNFIKFSYLKKFFYLDSNLRDINDKKIYDSINYYDVMNFLQNKFGQKNVKFELFENLNQNPEKFVGSILGFMDIDKSFVKKIDLSKKNPGKKTHNNEYFRKRKLDTKPLEGSLNIISKKIPFKKFFFSLFSRKLKDKIKIFSYHIDRVLMRHDRILLSEDDVIKIKKYYYSDNEKLSHKLNIDLKDLNY